MILDATLLNTLWRVKWSNPGNGVVLASTPRCSIYWKGILRVTLYYGRQIFLYISVVVFLYNTFAVYCIFSYWSIFLLFIEEYSSAICVSIVNMFTFCLTISNICLLVFWIFFLSYFFMVCWVEANNFSIINSCFLLFFLWGGGVLVV